MTEAAPTFRWPASATAALLAIIALCGCARVVAGHAAWTGMDQARLQAAPSGGAPGVVTTVPEHIPPNTFACFPGPSAGGIGTVAQAHDSAAPRITITVPDGWRSEPGQRDLALTLDGPGSMSGSVTIAATNLDPGRAFSDYAATVAHSKSGYHVETLGATFCGYSSQKLVGAFLNPTGVTEFADRLTHIATNTGNYLVVIHMEGPEDTPGFGAAKTVLLRDFAVVIP